MKPKFLYSLLSAAILVTAVGFTACTNSRSKITKRSRSEILSIVQSASIIESYRVKNTGRFYDEKVGDYYFVTGKGLNPDAKTARELKAVFVTHLKREANPHGQKGCPPPDPGVALRFVEGEKSVEILLCYHCYDLQVVNDVPSPWRDFYEQRSELVQIAKKLFPEDAEIQGLREAD